MDFRVAAWTAWAPQLETQQDWIAWSKNGFLPQGEAMPSVAAMPAMQRRRLQRLGRMALENLYALVANQGDELPIVFASRHGEAHRFCALVDELQKEASVSPQSFSLSVHNAVLGQYTIATQGHCNAIALSAGSGTALAGIIEACALLQEARQVLLLVCDEPLPDAFCPYVEEGQAAFSFAVLIEQGDEFSLQPGQIANASDDEINDALPQALAALRFLINPELGCWHPNGTDMAWQLVRKQ